MKKQLLGFSWVALVAFSQCHEEIKNPQLPPATAVGAMTFGCKINGKVFIPQNGRGHDGLRTEYVYLGPGTGGGWVLNVGATNWKPSAPDGMDIATDSLLVEEGHKYEFKYDLANNKPVKGCAYAGYAGKVEGIAGFNGYIKTNADTGSLHITKFDKTRRILAGTFAYSATNVSNGTKILVTEGRFDIRY